jgi:tetratricopeptide (TPR) repeat protein
VLDRTGPATLAASCRFYLGNIALHQERWDDAMTLHREALETRREQGRDTAVGTSLSALGAVCLRRGDYPHALDYYRQAEEHLSQHGSDQDVSFALLGLGTTFSRLGQHTAAAQAYRRCLALRAGGDDVVGEAIARLAVAESFLDLGELTKATEEARRSHFQLNVMAPSSQLGDAEQLLGRIRLRQKQPDAAREHLLRALELHRAHRDRAAAIDDRAWLLVSGIDRDDEAAVRQRSQELEEELCLPPAPECRERIDYLLFRAAEWLAARGGTELSEATAYLRRAYRELMRKTAYLPAELRGSFLLQVPTHNELCADAARHGVADEAGEGPQ